MIQIFYGNGKGKTSAAIGSAIRAAGRGMKILFVQFLKKDDSGERKVLSTINGVTMPPCPVELDFTFNMNSAQKAQVSKIFRETFERSVRTALTSNYSILILDEVFTAIEVGILSEGEVYNFLTDAPPHLEIILTGQNVSEKFIKIADYVSNIVKVKHPYDKGVSARMGIEF